MASSTKSDETMDTDSEKVATENIAGSLTSGEPVGDSGDKMEVNADEAVGNEEPRSKQQIKKDDSGISVEKSENSSDDDASKKQKTVNGRLQEDGSSSANGTAVFPKLKSRIRSRNYRIKKGRGVGKGSSDDEDESTAVESVHNSPKPGEGRSSPDSGHQESSSAPDDVEAESNKETTSLETAGIDSCRKRSRASESEESDSAGSEERKTELSDTELEEEEITPSVLLKQKPKHKWFVMQEVVNRYVIFILVHYLLFILLPFLLNMFNLVKLL